MPKRFQQTPLPHPLSSSSPLLILKQIEITPIRIFNIIVKIIPSKRMVKRSSFLEINPHALAVQLKLIPIVLVPALSRSCQTNLLPQLSEFPRIRSRVIEKDDFIFLLCFSFLLAFTLTHGIIFVK